jgi:hypothetical protein
VLLRFGSEWGWSAAGGALALLGVLITTRHLRRRFTTVSALALTASLITALLWFGQAWATYEVPETRLAKIGGACVLPVLALIAAVAWLLVLMSIDERRGERGPKR